MAAKKSKEKKIGVLNGDFAVDLYRYIPCKVGLKYMRVQVDGGVNPCCVMGTTMGSLQNRDYHDVWFSDAYAVFRERMDSIHKEHFHLNDPEWAFCQQCPHSEVNIESYFEEHFGESAKAVPFAEVRRRVFAKIEADLDAKA